MRLCRGKKNNTLFAIDMYISSAAMKRTSIGMFICVKTHFNEIFYTNAIKKKKNGCKENKKTNQNMSLNKFLHARLDF